MYKNKYLKYKQKYLYLKGGSIISKKPDTAASTMETNIEAIKNEFKKISIIYKDNSKKLLMNLCSVMSSLCDYAEYFIENEGLKKIIIVWATDWATKIYKVNTITETDEKELRYDINSIIAKNTDKLIKTLKNEDIKTAYENVVKNNNSKLIQNPLKFNYIINRFLKSDYALSAAQCTSTEYSICTSTEYTAICTEYNRIMYDRNTPKKETIPGFLYNSSEDFDAYNKRHGKDLIVALGNTTK